MGNKMPSVPSPKPSPYDVAMADIAKEVYETTDPMRQATVRQYEQMLTDGLDVTQLPQFAGTNTMLSAAYRGARPGLEDQYSVARQNVLESMPRGGAMGGALAGVEQSRARDVANLGAQMEQQRQAAIQGIINDMMQKAYGFATGAPQIAISGYGPAASNVAQRQMAQMGRWNPGGTWSHMGGKRGIKGK
jgi:hypothetical protein